MDKMILIEFPFRKTGIPATLLIKEEPEMCQILWDLLGQPMKMICHHTLSTGDFFHGCGRPPKHPIVIGSQATPLGKKLLLLSQLKPGSIVYMGGHDIAIAYGPDMTEPLVARGPAVARVSKAFLEELYEAGRKIWNAQFITHQLQTITLKRQDV
ncbi:MAG TPA: hypothetical protein VEF35_06430 [Candidatus Bathyarchaeia archaeon]|nr:hypothetical protein [Candidatus Bathyarchaeia archaeon]